MVKKYKASITIPLAVLAMGYLIYAGNLHSAFLDGLLSLIGTVLITSKSTIGW